MQGLVVCKNADLFTVESQDKFYNLKPSGKTKAKGIFVGDRVEFDENITKVLHRKNLLIRPPVANIDRMFIVLSQSPKPDFVLVDKILVYCALNDIEPFIVINKLDLCGQEFIKNVEEDYRDYQIIKVCAVDGNIESLVSEIQGLCVMAGQSAVGKSSIINAINKSDSEMVGSLSKIKRGKQTTRIVKLFKIGKNYLADTAGFSLLDLSMVSKIEERELASYYPDFLAGRGRCKYRSCLHTIDSDCGVIDMVKSGEVSKRRYENYLKILEEIKSAKKF